MNDTDKSDILAALASIKNSIDNKSCEPVVIEVDKEVVKPIRHDVVVKEPVIKEVEKQVVVKEPVIKVIEKPVVVKEPVIKEVEKKIIQVVEKPVEKTVVKVVEKVVKQVVYKDRETVKVVDCNGNQLQPKKVIVHDIVPPVPEKKKTCDVNIGRFKEQKYCLRDGIVISPAMCLPYWAHGKRYVDFKDMTSKEFKDCVNWMVELSKENRCCNEIYGGNKFKIYKLPSR